MANRTINLGPVRGENGTAASIRVGSVTTGEPGTPAKVVNSGTSSLAVLDFTIPKGSDGEPGAKGDPGNDGKSPYQAAVEQGYTGTEAEFYAALVSLKDAPFLPLKGGTMNGNLSISKGAFLRFLDSGGIGGVTVYDESESVLFPVLSFYGTFSNGPVNIRNIASPMVNSDAANKQYVDSASIPVGGIIIWSGSSEKIPAGWHLCDGQQGTPDLRDRFIMGAGGSYQVGDTGGEAAHTLTTEELPSHSHGSGSLSAVSAGSHTHSYYNQDPRINSFGVYSGGNDVITQLTTQGDTTGSSGSHTHTISGTTGATGSGTAHNNLPPYYALCYIMRIS